MWRRGDVLERESRRCRRQQRSNRPSGLSRWAALLVLAWVTVALARAQEWRAAEQPWGVSRSPLALAAGITEDGGASGPWLDLSSAGRLRTELAAGELPDKSADVRLEAVALSSDDFDGDGVPDLVVGYRGGERGAVILHRGDVGAAHPNAEESPRRERDSAPFLSPARRFNVPEPVEWMASGDFDNDGHWDVLAAAYGSERLFVLPGDGRGGLGEPRELLLYGRLTAAVVGEVNRRDGIADLVVAIEDVGGAAALLVYEGPGGVLAAKPERLPLPGAATSLVLDRLNDDRLVDVVAAAGTELVVVAGRDRRLSTSANRGGSRTSAPRVASLSLGFEIADLEAGDFLYERPRAAELAVLGSDGGLVVVPPDRLVAALELGQLVLERDDVWVMEEPGRSTASSSRLLGAHLSPLVADELLVLDRARSELRLHLTGPTPPAVARGLAKVGRLEDREPAVWRSEAPPVAALAMQLSPDPLADLVVLTEGAAEPVVLISKMGGGGTHLVNQTGTQTDAKLDGLCDINLATPELECTLTAAFDELRQATTGAGAISFAAPGTYPHFSVVLQIPVTIDGSSQGAPGAPGVALAGSGATGIRFQGGSSTVRAVALYGGSQVTFLNAGHNQFKGNFAGTDLSGTALSPSGAIQFVSSQAGPTVLGGTTPADRNVVVSNGSGLVANGEGDVVQGNYVGTDKTGTVALASLQNAAYGIQASADGVTVGGVQPGAGNLVSGHFNNGVRIVGDDVLFQGNIVGTDPSGTTMLGNQAGGISVGGVVPFPDMVTIGGTAPGAGNLISGNGFSRGEGGLLLTSRNARVQGNLIGTDRSGTVALGNRGVAIFVGGTDNVIGGSEPGAGNVIGGTVFNPSTSRGRGIWIQGLSTEGTVVEGNLIGMGLDGGALGNEGNGVDISNSTTNNRIGSTDPGAGNVIAFNGGAGVLVEGGGSTAGDGNAILGNSISDNGGLGIDLSNSYLGNGPNLNDAGDGDGGPNEGQNFPVLSNVAGNVQGSLASLPGETYRIELFSSPECDAAGFGEAEQFLASTQVATDASGNAGFDVAVGGGANVVTATATHLVGGQPRSTSELSVCVTRPGLVVNSAGDAPDLAPGNGFCDTGGVVARAPGAPAAKGVTSECTLRAAIQESNANPNPFFDFIRFDPERDPSLVIPITQPLPPIGSPLTIDGALPGGKKVEIRGGPGAGDGFTFAATGSVLRNLHITGFPGNGIVLGAEVEITDCVIGLDRFGTPRPNGGHGIYVFNGGENYIGVVKGVLPIGEPRVRGNVVSGNLGDGIRLDGSNLNILQGNRIGTSLDGKSSAPSYGNGGNGVTVRAGAQRNRIGGFGAQRANVISGNGGEGILVTFSADDTVIEGNFIGTDVTGTMKLPNQKRGVKVEDPTSYRTKILGNVIAGNLLEGVALDAVQETEISGNYVGTDRTGSLDLGNGMHGIALCCGAKLTSIGPPGNTVAHNGGHGIVLTGNQTVNNRFDLNRIYGNVGLGIDLLGDGVSLNDAGDGDGGSNLRQNFPLVTSYSAQGTATGTLSSTPLTSFLIELFLSAQCDPTGYGEAERFAAFASVVTDASGNGSWTANPGIDPDRPYLTAVATRRQFDDISLPTLIESSEISFCGEAEPGAPVLLINEVDARPAAASRELIELHYGPGAAVPLDGRVVVLYDGATDSSYAAFDLDGFSTALGGFFVLGNAGVTGASVVFADDLLLDGPAAVALYDGNATDFPNGTPVTTANLIDAVVYGAAGAPDTGLLPLLETAELSVDEAAAGDAVRDSIQRCGDGSGGARRTFTFAPAPPTPATSNSCVTCEIAPRTDSGATTAEHTLAVLVRIDGKDPAAGTEVAFEVIAGPNAGMTGVSTADNAGVVLFTYAGGGGFGLDFITASGSVAGRAFVCTATRTFGNIDIFRDGFESGDLSAWDQSVGGD